MLTQHTQYTHNALTHKAHSYEFPKTGGGTIRDMAREIGSNMARPLEKAADAAGGAVMSAADAVTGAGETVRCVCMCMCVLVCFADVYMH